MIGISSVKAVVTKMIDTLQFSLITLTRYEISISQLITVKMLLIISRLALNLVNLLFFKAQRNDDGKRVKMDYNRLFDD